MVHVLRVGIIRIGRLASGRLDAGAIGQTGGRLNRRRLKAARTIRRDVDEFVEVTREILAADLLVLGVFDLNRSERKQNSSIHSIRIISRKFRMHGIGNRTSDLHIKSVQSVCQTKYQTAAIASGTF